MRTSEPDPDPRSRSRVLFERAAGRGSQEGCLSRRREHAGMEGGLAGVNPPSPLSLTQGTTMRLTNQEKKIQKAVRREVPGEQRRRGRVRVRWCRICEKVRIAKLTGKRTVPCGTCGGLMLTAWVWREQLTEMSVHELRGLFPSAGPRTRKEAPDGKLEVQ